MPFDWFSRARLRLVPLITFTMASAPLRAQNATPPSDLNANFVGNWVGQLEYRDYSSNERVFLPTWLAITESSDHRSLDFNYIYDDGPNKTVRERMTFRLDAGASKASLTDHGQTKDTSTTQRFDVSGLDEFRNTGRGVLHLTGEGMDDGKRVDVRVTMTLRRNLYSWRKEIRPAGDTDERSHQFRDGYVFTRARSPAAP